MCVKIKLNKFEIMLKICEYQSECRISLIFLSWDRLGSFVKEILKLFLLCRNICLSKYYNTDLQYYDILTYLKYVATVVSIHIYVCPDTFLLLHVHYVTLKK